jgi:hypothetical protein
MRKCMMTDVVYSKIMNGFDNYERNTGQRHPMQPEAVSTSSKRDAGTVPLTPESLDTNEGVWSGMLARLSDWLYLMRWFYRPYLGGNAPGEWSGLLRLPPCSNWWRYVQKQFNVQYDTGSADLFVSDSSCDSTCAGRHVYDHSASTTSKDLDEPFFIMRGSTSFRGKQYNDTVGIAGLTATPQTLGAVRPSICFT